MNIKPKVSIIVAVYNAEKYLKNCLESLISQTYDNIEIICVNDASTDGSQQIIDMYKCIDKRVKSIEHKDNMNAGGAMNDGIKAATGSYICIVDNDDWLENNAIESLIKYTEDGKVDIVLTGINQTFDGGKINQLKTIPSGISHDEIVKRALLNGAPLLGSLIKKELYIKNNLFYPEKKFYEDNPVHFSLFTCSHHIVPTGLYVYNYYQSAGSVTRSTNIKKIEDRIFTTNLLLNNVKRIGTYNKYHSYVNAAFVHLSCHTIRLLGRTSLCKALPLLKEVIYHLNLIKKDVDDHLIIEKYKRIYHYPICSFVVFFCKFRLLKLFSF